MQIYTIEGFLAPEECDRARTLFPTPSASGGVLVDAEGSAKEEVRDVRQSRTSFAARSPEYSKLVARVLGLIQRANEVAYAFEISRLEPLQLAEYRVDDHYGWHLDIGPGRASVRKLSASVQLSQESEYEGGDLELWGSGSAPRSQGSAIVFPSYLLHRVTPVTRGLRRSLVAWATDNRAFR